MQGTVDKGIGVSGRVEFETEGALGRVTLRRPGKFNAMTRAMWRELKVVFTRIQARAELRCVLVSGDGGNFCAGGDIAEYPDFRFDIARLRAFHEDEVWAGLAAMLACDVPLIAAISGHCMGAGLEIASCCDIRVASQEARFGAPIARLGFPMAPREAALLLRAAGEATARELLLEAAVIDAAEMKARGFLHRVVPQAELMDCAHQRAERMMRLAPQAARLNKRTLRALMAIQDDGARPDALRDLLAGAYDYADSAEHREGVGAFLDKRPPRFGG